MPAVSPTMQQQRILNDHSTGTDHLNQSTSATMDRQDHVNQPTSAAANVEDQVQRTSPANGSNTAGFPQSYGSQSGTTSGAPDGRQHEGNPYILTGQVPPPVSNPQPKSPMNSIVDALNKWGKKAEDVTGDVWGHLRTGPDLAGTALGRLTMGKKVWEQGGMDKVFAQTFEPLEDDERMLKTFACFLSMSSGPMAGTLYISTHRLAFCSDRPLRISKPPSTPQAEREQQQQQQQQTDTAHYYKVAVPLALVEAVNGKENMQKKMVEKYVQVMSVDGHDFWFMGFVHYEKALKTLQEILNARDNVTPIDNKSLSSKNAKHFQVSSTHDDATVASDERNLPFKNADYIQGSSTHDDAKNLPSKNANHIQSSSTHDDAIATIDDKNLPSKDANHVQGSSTNDDATTTIGNVHDS